MIAVLSAPSNLGLRPPEATSVPGCAKAPEALREAGLFRRFAELGAVEAGVVLPGRYRDDVRSGELRNQEAIVDHAHRLAARTAELRAAGQAPLVLGGDCSLLIGTGLALRRTGRYGLVHLDGHTDFRHPGNSAACASLAGEDLAAAIGLHWPAVSDIEGRTPYFRPTDAVHIGCRDDDEHLTEARRLLASVVPASAFGHQSAAAVARDVRSALGTAGFWLHVDVDILDPSHLPAVDSPDPGGLTPGQLADLLTHLAPQAIGAQVTVFDPDLDPDGRYARLLTDILVTGLAQLGTAAEEQARITPS